MAFWRGSEEMLAVARRAGALLAVLKAKSPSCGVHVIYDGTYTGSLTEGEGVYARLLEEEGICVVSEETVESCKPSVEHPVAIVLDGPGTLPSSSSPCAASTITTSRASRSPRVPCGGTTSTATVGTIDDVPVVVYPGRIHLYQGYSAF